MTLWNYKPDAISCPDVLQAKLRRTADEPLCGSGRSSSASLSLHCLHSPYQVHWPKPITTPNVPYSVTSWLCISHCLEYPPLLFSPRSFPTWTSSSQRAPRRPHTTYTLYSRCCVVADTFHPDTSPSHHLQYGSRGRTGAVLFSFYHRNLKPFSYSFVRRSVFFNQPTEFR